MELSCLGWSSGSVMVATTFRARWRGMRPFPQNAGLLLRAASVHGFGMRCDLLVVGLDASFAVTGCRVLRPRRVVVLTGAVWTLELSPATPAPPVGARLAIAV